MLQLRQYEILNKHAPIKTIRVRGNNLPYVMAEVKSMVRKRDYLRGKASKTGSKYLQQAFQHLCQFLIITQKIEDNKDNLRNMWKVLKRVINRKGKCNLVDKITVNNTEITNKQEISDKMNEYFA